MGKCQRLSFGIEHRALAKIPNMWVVGDKRLKKIRFLNCPGYTESESKYKIEDCNIRAYNWQPHRALKDAGKGTTRQPIYHKLGRRWSHYMYREHEGAKDFDDPGL